MCIGNGSTSNQVVDGDRKRKVSSGITELYHSVIIHPRFTSSKVIKMHHSPFSWKERESASFESLPQEIFCSIVAYLGPTSTSLCSLSQVTRSHNAFMKTIGDVMLPEAKKRFRVPLAPMADGESSISLFVRHARVAKEVHENLLILENTLAKNFPTFDSSKDYTFLNSDNTVTPYEVDQALDVALSLLGSRQLRRGLSIPKSEVFYFDSKISAYVATTALEWKVSKLCAVLGAKAYKYAKAIMCDRVEDILNTPYQVTDEYNAEDDFSLGSVQSDDEDDAILLEKACTVMQLTVARDIEIARQVQQASGGDNFSTKRSVLGKSV